MACGNIPCHNCVALRDQAHGLEAKNRILQIEVALRTQDPPMPEDCSKAWKSGFSDGWRGRKFMGRYDASHLRFRIAERGGYDAGVMDFNRAFGAAMKAAFAEGI